MKTIDFNYELPGELIAQNPAEPRDHSRLMVLDRKDGAIEHKIFKDIGAFLRDGDLLILNQTRVIPGRVFGKKLPSGGRVELLLLHPKTDLEWEVIVGGKGLTKGKKVQINGGPVGEILKVLDGPRRLIKFAEPTEKWLNEVGELPLPPYIRHSTAPVDRYQTVYARVDGSAAAPTAGLHFTPGLIAGLKAQGIQFAEVTLHIGLDTFAPVRVANPREHEIHTEWCQVPEETAVAINQTRSNGGRVICVGTTSVRSVESAAHSSADLGKISPFEGPTNLFILPGYKFRVVDGMITNFHLPQSTLLMMISAFAGREKVLSAYETAIKAGYRFYSFGDAMLIV